MPNINGKSTLNRKLIYDSKCRWLLGSVCFEKENESIIINDNIIVTVVEIRGDKVRLGFEAP